MKKILQLISLSALILWCGSVSAQLTVTVSKTNATSGCNGTATASATGGAAPYTFSWSNSATSAYIDSLCAGAYTVIVTDTNNLSDTASVTIINDTTLLIVSVTKTNATSGCNGNATATATGGLAPYVYSWSNGGNTTYIDSLCAGTFNLTVTDVNGDTAIASVTITLDTTSTLIVSVTKTNATSGCNGNATAAVTGGLAPYVYSWSNGGNTTYIDSLCAGTYNLTVTDVNGDTAIASVTITLDTTSTLIVSVTKTNVTNGCNGTATASATGGTAPYTFYWTIGGPGTYKDSLCAGLCNLFVYDVNGASDSTSFYIDFDSTLSVSVSTTSATGGACNGNATASVLGGTSPFTYSWSTGGNGTYEDSLCTGTYNVIVTDINGASDTASYTIASDTTALSVTISTTDAQSGECIGNATATVSGGTAPYTYSWSTGGNGTYKDSLCAGTFSFIVTDVNGASDTASFTIVDPSLLYISVSITSATSGACNGNATASITGGAAPYTYSWSSGGNTAYEDSLCAGTYNVIITDLYGTSDSASVTITSDTTSTLIVSVTKTNATSGCNGNATATATGGLAPYVYFWSNGGNTSYIDSLCAGTYNLTVTDVNGDTAIASVTITLDTTSTLIVSVTKTDATSGCNGNATATVTGGLAPYVYSWSNGGNTSYIDSLCAGTYNLTVTDVNGDSATASVTITSPPLVVSVSTTQTTGGVCNGNATASATGGSAPYVYSWSTGGNGTYKDSLCAGTFNVIVTDINGITDTASFTITNDTTSALIASVSITQTTGGDCNGTATASATGGSAPYVYLWSTGGNGTYKDSLCLGTFNVIVTDINGLSDTASFTIIADTTYNPCNSFTASVSSTLNQTFPGACDGTAISAVNNGVAPYLFNWGTGLSSTTPQFSGLCAGSFTLTVTDANGCSTTAIGSVGTDSVVGPCNGVVINVALTTTSASAGLCDGAVFSTVAGGTAPYIFTWSNGYHTSNLANACPGYYNVQIQDAIGCLGASNVFVQGDTTVPIPLMISISTNDVDSIGVCNGSAHVNAAGGVGPYSIIYSNGFSGGQVNNLCGGYYAAFVTDVNGLSDSISFVIGSPENTFINDTASDPLNDSVVVATLTSEAILSCGIDFTTIDSIAVTDYYLGNGDSIVVVWTLYSIVNGDTLVSQLYGAGQDGVYEVVLSLFCDGRSTAGFAKAYSKILVNDQLTGIKTNNEIKTKTVVYPNPFNTLFNINLKETAKVTVTDITGKTIIVRQANSGTLQIPANNLAKGIYFVIIENNKGREVTKLIKE